MLLNVEILKKDRNYRLLYLGQFVSEFGSMMSYIALPYQVFELTQSSLWVGALGAVEFLPLVVFGIYGGSFADRINRKLLLVGSELIMVVAMIGLILNSIATTPSVTVIFGLAFLLQAATGFHRPALEALSQALAEPRYYASMAALTTVRHHLCSIAGPALGGALMAWKGSGAAYALDLFSFLIALGSLIFLKIPPLEVSSTTSSHTESIFEGIRYALKRPELMGTYLVDVIAMTFAFPVSLFPEMAQGFGGAQGVGLLFSAMSFGSVTIALLSGWTDRVKRHGRAILIAAGVWGLAVIGLGAFPHLSGALFCLILAGAADTVSALFRSVIWNQTIPNEMRGRLAGIEMISYMAGPLLGNMRAGAFASMTSVSTSIVSGGVLCVLGMFCLRFFLPAFWAYSSQNETFNNKKV